MFTESFQLTKRFRYQEEHAGIQPKASWTKVLLNLENGTILTRTPLHWLYLLVFYAIFFCGIFVLWFLCYWNFDKTTLTSERPKRLLTQPGFSFEPATTFRENYLKIEYHELVPEEVDELVDHINKALAKYGQIPEEYFGECNNLNDYGYRDQKPCFFLKINRIIGFKTLALENIKDLPKDVPRDLYEYLQNLSEENLKQRIWISCDSRPSLQFLYYPQRFYEIADVDYVVAKTLNNSNGFYNEHDFKRIISVQVENISLNVKHHVRCFLWAKNIVRDLKGKMGKGLVRFSLEIKT